MLKYNSTVQYCILINDESGTNIRKYKMFVVNYKCRLWLTMSSLQMDAS